jgi:hypothetical protein
MTARVALAHAPWAPALDMQQLRGAVIAVHLPDQPTKPPLHRIQIGQEVHGRPDQRRYRRPPHIHPQRRTSRVA